MKKTISSADHEIDFSRYYYVFNKTDFVNILNSNSDEASLQNYLNKMLQELSDHNNVQTVNLNNQYIDYWNYISEKYKIDSTKIGLDYTTHIFNNTKAYLDNVSNGNLLISDYRVKQNILMLYLAYVANPIDKTHWFLKPKIQLTQKAFITYQKVSNSFCSFITQNRSDSQFLFFKNKGLGGICFIDTAKLINIKNELLDSDKVLKNDIEYEFMLSFFTDDNILGVMKV